MAKVAITGSSGLIGGALAASLTGDGHEVIRLVRGPASAAGEVHWDPQSPGGLDPAVLDGIDAVVNLAGASIAGGRWTDARKAELRSSRIQTTATLVRAIKAAAAPPATLVSGSAIGWYGDTGDQAVDESAPAGAGFLAGLVRDWEQAAAGAREAGTRVACARTGIVLSRAGGMLGQLLPAFRLGLGARLGGGDQYISWITLTDEVRAIRFLLDTPAAQGAFNLTAPEPVTNTVFTALLAAQLSRPALLRLPSVLLKAGLGELSGELLSSARVLPRALTEAGFEFRHRDLRTALAAELATGRPAA